MLVVLVGLNFSFTSLDAAEKSLLKKSKPTTAAPSGAGKSESVEKLAETARKSVVVVSHFGRDGKEDGKRKLSQAVFRRYGASGPQIVDLFESAQLDLALGRSNVIHAALKQGAASKAFLARCRRLAAYRAERQDDTGGPMPAQQNPGTND